MSISSRYSIVEPHPSVTPRQQYIGTGRGGAGNVVKAPTTITRGSDASGPASRAASLSVPRRTFYSGRGGAGNHVNDAPRMFSFDEELAHEMQQSKHIAPVYHVGRGGAGNLCKASSSTNHNLTRRMSDTSTSSTSSAESGADVATRNLKKGFKKLTNVF